jgi:hypothetical protein
MRGGEGIISAAGGRQAFCRHGVTTIIRAILKRKDKEMYNGAEFLIFDEEIKEKLNYDRQSAYNDISGIFAFASDVLKTGGKVTVRRQGNEDFTITEESGLNAYKEGLNEIQSEQNRRLI